MIANSSPSGQRGVVVVEFALSDPAYPFVELSGEESCRVVLEKMLPRGTGEYAEFFSVRGADPDRVLDSAQADDRVSSKVLSRYDDGGLFEFVVEEFCPAKDLSELGAIPREVTSEDGEGQIIAEIPTDVSASRVIDDFLDTHPTVELRAKQTTDRLTPLFTRNELRKAVSEQLTDRQWEVLQTAFEASYYDPTEETTGEQVGNRLGIDPSTVSQHLNAAERKLVSILLEDDRLDRESD